MNTATGMAAVLGSLGLLFGGVRALPRRVVDAELSRKCVHMGMGVVCLSFPWLFRGPAPVWALSVAAVAALGAVRTVPVLRRLLGGVLHGVERASWGELYFPLGVAAVFTLAEGRAVLFVVPVALLAFADAAGALVGKRWGRRRYETLEGAKSLEGSAAVGVTALLCTALPLWVSGYDPTRALLVAVLLGLLGLLVEAISWRGLDNVFLPLAAFVQLRVADTVGVPDLLARVGVLAALTAVALFWRRGRIVDDSARLAGAVALYYVWAVGGWRWLVAPVLLLASYVRLMPSAPGGAPRHNLTAVVGVGAPAFACCIAASVAGGPGWLWPYTLGLAAQQAIIASVRYSQRRPQWSRAAWWAAGVAQAVVLQVPMYLLLERGAAVTPGGMAVGAAGVAVAAAGFVVWEKQLQEPDSLALRWWKQACSSLAASLAGFVFMNL